MTPRPRTCRLLLDSPADGAWNMAVDEVLLAAAAETGRATLRLYGWSQPTLSLGYFQHYEARHQHAASENCAVVRRMTGGGAILHDRELTYSICWFEENQGKRADFKWLYDAVHDTLRAELAAMDVTAARANGRASTRDQQAFLCFQRLSQHDVVFGDAKIVGSAQRRTKSAVLQHGSILLETSPHAPEVSGLQQLRGKAIECNNLCQTWPQRLAEKLDLDLVPATLSDRELRQSGELVRVKYGSTGWSCRR